MYDILFVIGDSYSTPGKYVSIEDSYWKKFQSLINAQTVVNYAHPSKSNFDMCRNTLRFHLQNKSKRVFYLIGYSHFFRTDILRDNIVNEYNQKNGNLSELHIHPYPFKDSKELTINSNYCHEFANFYTNVILLYNYLENNNLDFLMHNCGEKHQEELNYPLVKDFVEEFRTMKKFPNLFGNTYLSVNKDKQIKPIDFYLYKWCGHHGAPGNQNYFLYLKSIYESIYIN